jgi:hypothetical protein
MELLLATGLPLSEIMIIIFMDVSDIHTPAFLRQYGQDTGADCPFSQLFMIIGGLIGALVPSVYKWGYFVG